MLARHVQTRSPYERAVLLKSFPLFADLDAEYIAVFASYAEEHWYRRGQSIGAKERTWSEAHIVLEGAIEERMEGRVVRRIDPPNTVGLVEILAQMDRSTVAIAACDVLILTLPREALLEIVEARFEVLFLLVRATARALLREEDLLDGIGMPSAPPIVPEWCSPLDVARRMSLLAAALPFASHSAFGLADLARRATERRFEAGERLWSAGEPAASLHVVGAGTVVREHPERASREEGPGQVSGLLEAISDMPRADAGTARTPGFTLELDVDWLIDVLEEREAMAMGCLRGLARRLVLATEERALRHSGVQSGGLLGAVTP